MFKTRLIHEIRDDCIIMYSLNDVVLKDAPKFYKDSIDAVGKVLLTEYLDTRARYLEWKPVPITDDVEGGDWNIISNSNSNCINSDQNQVLLKSIKIPLHYIRKYSSVNGMMKFNVFANGDQLLCRLWSNRDHFQGLFDALNGMMLTSFDKDDPLHLHRVVTSVFEHSSDIYRTLLDLEMFLDKFTTSTLWKFVEAFHDVPVRPVEDTFTKLGLWLDETPENLSKPDDMPDTILLEAIPESSSESERAEPYSLSQYYGSFKKVKQRILEGGIKADSRKTMWKYLLKYYKWPSSTVVRADCDKSFIGVYRHMQDLWSTMGRHDFSDYDSLLSRMTTLTKEITRKDSVWRLTGLKSKQIHNIMKSYMILSYGMGYLYGLSDILFPIALVMKNEVESYEIFRLFINKYINNFIIDETDIRFQLKDLYVILKVVDPEYAAYFKKNNCQHMFFCMRWLYLLFTKEFDHLQILILFDVLLLDLPCPHFHLLIAIAMLLSQKDYIMTNNLDFLQILGHVNTLKNSVDVMKIIKDARKIHLDLEEIFKDPKRVNDIMNMEVV